MANRSEQRIKRLLDENNGILIASEAIGSGIPRNAVYDFARERGLEKASLGIFVDADVFPDGLYLLQARYSKVVFSHEMALYLHDMAEREFVPIALTVESGYHVGSLKNQGVRIFLREAGVVRPRNLRGGIAGRPYCESIRQGTHRLRRRA